MPCHLRLVHCTQITGSSPLWPRVGRGGESFRALLRANSAPSSHPRGRWSASPARRWRACSRPRLRLPRHFFFCPRTRGLARRALSVPLHRRQTSGATSSARWRSRSRTGCKRGRRRSQRRATLPPPLLPAARPCGQPSAGRGTAVRRGATRTHAAGGRGAPHLRQEAAQGARDAAETQPRRSPTNLRQDAPPEARATRRLHVGRTSAAPRPHLCHLSLAHRLGRCATGSACPTRRRWPSCARRRWSTRPSGGCTARCTSSRRWRLPAGLACRQEASPLTRHGRVGRLRAQDVWHKAAGVRLVPPRLGGSHRLRTYTTDAHRQQPTDPGHQPLPPTRPHTAADPDTPSTHLHARPAAGRCCARPSPSRGRTGASSSCSRSPTAPTSSIPPPSTMPSTQPRRRRDGPQLSGVSSRGGRLRTGHPPLPRPVCGQAVAAGARTRPVASLRAGQRAGPGASLLPRSRFDASCCEQDPHSEASQALVEASEMSSLPPPPPRWRREVRAAVH